jgi:3-deoxy-D-manno-octulosonic acid (KDO) 8-phosphate synthase
LLGQKILNSFCTNILTKTLAFIIYSVCERSSHIDCLQITEEQHEVIGKYDWACIECKTCTVCAQARNEEQILFCDRCDRGYHTFCVALRSIPKSKMWTCRVCFKEDPSYSERHGGKKMRARRRKTKNLKEFLD